MVDHYSKGADPDIFIVVQVLHRNNDFDIKNTLNTFGIATNDRQFSCPIISTG